MKTSFLSEIKPCHRINNKYVRHDLNGSKRLGIHISVSETFFKSFKKKTKYLVFNLRRRCTSMTSSPVQHSVSFVVVSLFTHLLSFSSFSSPPVLLILGFIFPGSIFCTTKSTTVLLTVRVIDVKRMRCCLIYLC